MRRGPRLALAIGILRTHVPHTSYQPRTQRSPAMLPGRPQCACASPPIVPISPPNIQTSEQQNIARPARALPPLRSRRPGCPQVFYLNRMIDVSFIIDIFRQFVMPYVDRDTEQEVYDNRSIAKHYMKGRWRHPTFPPPSTTALCPFAFLRPPSVFHARSLSDLPNTIS